jgi:DNA-binding GntR family transcriptional regulator
MREGNSGYDAPVSAHPPVTVLTRPARPSGRRVGSKGAASLYKTIADQLRVEIQNGVYPLGSMLPPEQSLCERFDAGRHTIRDAVRVLVDEGMLMRRAGDGTKVIAVTRQRTFSQTIYNFDQWINLPDRTARQTHSATHIVADAELASTIKCQFGAALFHIRALRVPPQAPAPISLMDIYVQPRFAAIAKTPDHAVVPIHEQIERRFGDVVVQVDIDMLARLIPPDIAALLNMEPNTLSMVSVRRFLSASGEALVCTVSIYPSDRVNCALSFRRDLPLR